jgi:transposase
MRAYSLDLRGKIIDAFFHKEGSIRELASRFKVSFRFVWGFIDRYRKTGSMAPKPHGGGYPPTIKEENYGTLRKIEEQNPDATLEELCDLFEKQCHVKPSKAGMYRTLKKLNLTRKKKTFHASEQERDDVQRKRKEFKVKMSKVGPRCLVFVDEAGVNVAMARDYARSPKGERAYAHKPHNKGENITILGALSLEGITASMTVEGGTDKAVFLTYVKEILVPSLRAGNVVVMDNLSSHNGEEITEAIKSVGARVEYLPEYSPELSPIEEAWSKFKGILRAKAARVREVLDPAITYALNAITPDDANGWFTHCGYCSTSN